VAHCLAIDIHLAEGAMIYDFMAGEARYKASLGESGPEMYHLLLQRPTWALRLEFGLRTLKACPRAELEDRLALGAGLGPDR
jgi:hypothetical protein